MYTQSGFQGSVIAHEGYAHIDSDPQLQTTGHVPRAMSFLVHYIAHLIELVHLNLVWDPLDPLAATQHARKRVNFETCNAYEGKRSSCRDGGGNEFWDWRHVNNRAGWT